MESIISFIVETKLNKAMPSEYQRLTDSEWEVIIPILKNNMPRTLDLRAILDAIRWINKTGSQWRNLDSGFPKWQSVYYYHRKWSLDGTTKLIMNTLVVKERIRNDRDACPSLIAVDSQSIKAAPSISEDRGIDGNKKINGRKRHLAVDTLGLPWVIHVGAANQHDGEAGLELLYQMEALKLERLELIRADSTYGGLFEESAKWYDWQVNTTQRPPSQQGFVPEKNRWQVERSFAWLNGYRRLSKDCEKKARTSEAFIALAFADLILARF